MSKSNMKSTSLLIFLTLLLLLPILISGECTCELQEEEEDGNKSSLLSLKYKLAAIASILVASAIGVGLPSLGKLFPVLSPERNLFFMVKAFAAGVILATGFIHVLPEAFERLTSACIPEKPWGDFPFTGFIAMMAAIGTLMVDTYATSYYGGRAHEKLVVDDDDQLELGSGSGGGVNVPVHSHHAATHDGHSHGGRLLLLRQRVISQVLELGIIVHSVIIGIAVGASQSPTTIKPLIVALTFHQFFEGIGLGGCITQAKFNARAVAIMGLFFSLTTPVGIAIGIGITNVYSQTSATALIVQGVFDSASAGILIYMALVDLLAPDFMSPKMLNNGKLQLGANASLLLGLGLMSMLAKWA